MTFYVVVDMDADDISIHTPARGVTKTSGLLRQVFIISIHTPARGVTPFDDE